MPDEMVCPRCQRANDARSEFCERCGRWLQDVSGVADANRQRGEASEDADDIQEELASVRRQLTEATTLVGDLHNRVSRLEARVSRDGDIPATSSLALEDLPKTARGNQWTCRNRRLRQNSHIPPKFRQRGMRLLKLVSVASMDPK